MKVYALIIGIAMGAVALGGYFLWQRMKKGTYKLGWAEKTGPNATSLPQQTNDNYWTVENFIHLNFIHIKPQKERISVKKEVILWVHGGPAVAPHLPHLASVWLQHLADVTGMHCFAYHSRGCGDSSRPILSFPKSQQSFRHFSSNLKLLEERLGLTALVGDIERIRLILRTDRFVLIGHSFGGFISSLYSAEFPNRVAALCLISPSPLYKFPLPSELNLFSVIEKRLPAQQRSHWLKFLSDYLDFSPKILKRDEDFISSLHFQFSQFYLDAIGADHIDRSVDHFPSDFNNNDQRLKFVGGWAAMAIYFSMGMQLDWRDFIRQRNLSKNVHLIVGEKDICDSIEIVKATVSVFPQARIDRLDDAGHFPFLSHPHQLAHLISQFLQSIELQK